MKKLIVLKFLFLLGTFMFLILFWAVDKTPVYASTVLFQDNFESGSATQWTNLSGNGLWQVRNINGSMMYGARIDTPSTTIDTVATNVNPPNYQIDFDYLPIVGTDRNLDFRYKRNSPAEGYNPYEVHFLNSNSVWTNFGYPSFTSPTPLIDNQLNHVTIILQGQHIQFILNGTKIIDYVDSSYQFTGDEKIGLRISTGGAFPTEAWFDNIVVTNLDNPTPTPTPLTVPYFNQNDSPWGQTEYDHVSGKLSNPTMDRWGCVVTSVAMVLKFHNINQFADGTTINPGSLNNWLKSNNGYLTGKGSDGYYSYFNWPIIGKLTKQLFDAGKSNTKLMHKRAYPSSTTTTLLNDDLNLRKFPDILGVNNSQTSSHFVVAKGISGNTYSINDPEWNYPTLASFNSYTQVDRYVPSQTNLSYLVAVVNPSVELLITNPQNSKTGKYFDNGQLKSSNEINNASYSFQAPISNPNNQNLLGELGTGVNEFLLPEPEKGKYQIKLSSKQSGIYEINIASFEKEGNNELNKIRGVISSNNDEIIEIDYSQDQVSKIKRTISFQSLINDINEAKNLDLIKPWIPDTLIKLAKNSQKNAENGRKQIAKIQLNVFENMIKSIRKSPLIKEDAYQILLYDVNYLKNNL